MEDNFPLMGSGDGFRMVQVHYVSCALYFLDYYVSSTSDRRALDHRGRGPLLYSIQYV